MIRRIAGGLAALGIALTATLVTAAPAQAEQTFYRINFSFSGKCLEPTIVHQKKPLRQWTCDGVHFQRWYFDYVGHDAQGQAFWRIRNFQSGLCINNQGDNRGVLAQGTCGAWGWNETWQLVPTEGIHFRLYNVQSRLCATLGAGDKGKANGATIFQQGCGTQWVSDPAQQYITWS